MIVRCVRSAFVSAAVLAAIAMSGGTAHANSPSTDTELVRSAYQNLKQGDAKAAVLQFTKAIDSGQLEPEIQANALLNRALAYQHLGGHEQAVSDYTAALALGVMARPLQATALYNRGLSHYKQKMLRPAIEDFTTSLLLSPNSPFAYYSRGNALRDSAQFLFALSDYERALRYGHPDKARVLLASANTYIALNRLADAKKALNAALEANPDFGEARAQLILLGDQNAKSEDSAADPIMTSSVAALAGGTLATKPELPAAVAPPANLVSTTRIGKLFYDRVPSSEDNIELASAAAEQPAEPEVPAEEVIEAEEMPEIPAQTQAAAAADDQADEIAEASEAEATAASAETTASVLPAETGGWSVQVASATSQDAAWSTWKKMQSRYRVLKAQSPVVVRADLGAKGIYYRVRLAGFEDRKAASKACAKLKAGGVNCYVSKSGS
jgi:tetratricopeptide (TPR) repeat protein